MANNPNYQQSMEEAASATPAAQTCNRHDNERRLFRFQ
jgi:hypothetical protein